MGESSPCVSPHTICWTISHFIHNHSVNCPWNKEGWGNLHHVFHHIQYVQRYRILFITIPWIVLGIRRGLGNLHHVFHHIQYVERYRILFITIQWIAHGIRRRMGESSPCVSPHTICWTISHFIHNHSVNCPWNKEGGGESSPCVSPHTICWTISHFIHNHSVNCPWNKEEDGGIFTMCFTTYNMLNDIAFYS